MTGTLLAPYEEKKYKASLQTPELDERDTLLSRLDNVLKESARLAKKDRFGMFRIHKLLVLERNLQDYQERLMEQQVALKQMRTALEQELKITGRGW
jgi:hypothetical protein